MQKNLRLCYLTCFLAFLGLISASNVFAQTVDDTGAFDPPITGEAVLYTSLIVNDVNDNSGTDVLFTLSEPEVLGWPDYSVGVRFLKNNSTDHLDVYNGGSIVAPANVVPVEFGVRYHLWIAFDVPNKTYSAWVKTDAMESPVVLIENGGFKNQNISAINRWSAIHNPGGGDPTDFLTVETVTLVDESTTNANLGILAVDGGELSPAFDPTVTEYSVTLPAGTTSANISGAPEVRSARLTGVGPMDVTTGSNPATVQVVSEGGTTMNYNIDVIVSDVSTDATLSAITVDMGALSPAFDPAVTEYSLLVPEGTSEVNVSATANDGTASVAGDGAVDVSSGAGSATIVVTAADGSTMEYFVNITEATAGNHALSLPGVNGAASNVLIPAIEVTSLPVTIELLFKPDGTQPGYAGLFFNTDPAAGGLAYVGWQNEAGIGGEIGGQALPEDQFSKRTFSTEDAIPNEWNHAAVVLTETGRKLYLNGELYAQDFTPVAPDFTQGTTYIGWHDSEAGRAFKGLIDEVRFWTVARTAEEIENSKYSTLSGNETGLKAYWNFDDLAATVTDVTGNGADGVITGGTYAPSLDGSDARVSDITVSVGKLHPEFHPSIFEYEVEVLESTPSITVTATPNDPTASVSGDGVVELSSGVGVVPITITSLDGTSNRYTVNIKPYTGSNLALSLPGGADGAASNVQIPAIDVTSLPVTIELLFKPDGNQPGYAGLFFNTDPAAGGLAYVGWQNEGGIGGEIGGQALPEDQFSKRTFSTEDAIPNEWNHAAVVLTETGRKLYLNGELYAQDFTPVAPDFTQGTTYIGWQAGDPGRTFNGLIDEVRVWTAERTAEELANNNYTALNGDEAGLAAYWNFDDEAATVTDVTGNGANGTITGGAYVPSYDLTDATLSALTIDPGTLNPVFDPAVTEYTLVVPEGTTSVAVAANATDDTADLTGDGAVDVASGSGTATIEVTAGNGSTTKTYTVNITVEQPSADATLSALTVDAGSLNPVFDPAVTSYSLLVPYGTTSVMLSANPNDEHATLSGGGAVDVSSGSGTATVEVTAEDGTIATYTVDITVEEPSADATLSALTIDAGSLSPEFDPSVTQYAVVVPRGTNSVNVSATANDETASVSGAGAVDVSSGNGTATIVVTAEDGSTATYEVNFSEEMETSVGDELNNLAAVYPTLSKESFTVVFAGIPGTITVYDLSGKVVLQKKASSSEETINVTKSGMYVIRLQSKEGSKSVRVIKVD